MRKSTHTPAYSLLRERLAAMRAGAGLSQRDLARRIGVPHSWVAKVESGERRIDLVEFGWFCAGCDTVAADEVAVVLAETSVRRRLAGNKGAKR